MASPRIRILAAASLLSALPAARAIVFASTGDPTFNTTAPSGLLADSGWQYLGRWNGFVGTQISPNQFITAAHVGGTVGGSFIGSNGQTYTTTGVATQNDLAIWTVTGTLPVFAPLYTGSSENTLDMVMFGRGLGRGDELHAPSANDFNDLRGWTWGSNQTLRWGTNQFDTALTGFPVVGSALAADFDRLGGASEATVASGDSGGATFVRNGSRWELAGVIYGVQSSVRTTPAGPTVSAAVYDFGGLYGNNGALIAADGPIDIPASFIVSRISAQENQDWITTQVPEPSTYAACAATGLALAVFWIRRHQA